MPQQTHTSRENPFHSPFLELAAEKKKFSYPLAV